MNINAVPDDWQHANQIAFDDVRRRLDGATLAERNAVLEFVRSNLTRIHPVIVDSWHYDSMSSYLLDCVTRLTDSNADDESVHTPFEAAHELVEWFNWIAARDNNSLEIQKRINRIAVVFKNGCNSVQNCIETGFLEHVLEFPRNRPYFANWKDDEILAESYAEALRWGEAHTKPDTT